MTTRNRKNNRADQIVFNSDQEWGHRGRNPLVIQQGGSGDPGIPIYLQVHCQGIIMGSCDAPDAPSTLDITVEFSGGLEILFSNKRSHKVSLPAKDVTGATPNVGFLVRYLCENVMKDERKELFLLQGTVRPGILVLINDSDWELEGEEKYEIQPGDNILFVSTLHGG